MVDHLSEAISGAKRRVGTTIKDKWHIDELLGVGGMSAVFAATHRNKNRAALKILWKELSLHEQVQKRFLREGYLANSIPHPGVVRIYDDDIADDGSAFLVMELLEGKHLGRLRKQHGGQLPVELAFTIMDAVLDVLVVAHEHGIIHRDIKPSNILKTNDGKVKVLDFGIARVRDDGAKAIELTATGMLLGTAQFMSPEQARAHSSLLDARTDIYSSGATLFKVLSGEFVHQAVTEAERLALVLTQPARSLGTLRPDLPAPVIALVDRALAYEPDARFPDAKRMQTAIRECFQSVANRSLDQTVLAEVQRPGPSTALLPSVEAPNSISGHALIDSNVPYVSSGQGGAVVDAVPPANLPYAPPVMDSNSPYATPAYASPVGYDGNYPQAAPPKTQDGLGLLWLAAAAVGILIMVALVGSGVYFMSSRGGSEPAASATATASSTATTPEAPSEAPPSTEQPEANPITAQPVVPIPSSKSAPPSAPTKSNVTAPIKGKQTDTKPAPKKHGDAGAYDYR